MFSNGNLDSNVLGESVSKKEEKHHGFDRVQLYLLQIVARMK